MEQSTMGEGNADREWMIDAARLELSFVAARLVGMMPSTDAAKLFAEVVVAIVECDLGREKAVSYMRGLVVELESSDEGASINGRA